MRRRLTYILTFVVSFSTIFFAESTNAYRYKWEDSFSIDGREKIIYINPTYPIDLPQLTIVPYRIDYKQLEKRLKQYQWIYSSGQLAHGYFFYRFN